MSIYKQKYSKYWWISVYQPGSRRRIRISSGTTDKGKAASIEHLLRIAAKKPTNGRALHAVLDSLLDDVTTHLLLADAAVAYTRAIEDTNRRPSQGRIKFNQLAIRRFSEWLTEDPRVTVASITRQHAVQYARHLGSIGAKTKTRKNHICALATVWRILGAEFPEITFNPWSGLAPEVTDSVCGKAFTHEQETAVLHAADAINADWGTMCRIARFTGLRFSDVKNLRQENVDRVNRCLRVTPSKTKKFGVTVVLPLPEEVFARIPADREQLFRKQDIPFRKILADAGLDGKGFTFHSWRHTFRTRLSEAGVSDDIAKRLGGWTNDKMAAHYDHADRLEEMRAAVLSTTGGAG